MSTQTMWPLENSTVLSCKGWEWKSQIKSWNYYEKKSFDPIDSLKGSQGCPGVPSQHFENHCSSAFFCRVFSYSGSCFCHVFSYSGSCSSQGLILRLPVSWCPHWWIPLTSHSLEPCKTHRSSPHGGNLASRPISHQASRTRHSWKRAVWQVHGCLWAQAYARVTLTLSQREASLQISNSGGERS